MKNIFKFILFILIVFAFLPSCAFTPQQIVERTLALTKDSTVRLVSQDGKPITLGSGFFVDKDKIATNIHVVGQSGSIFAELSNKEKTLSIEGVAAFDVKNNLVILKLTGEGNPLPIGDSNVVQKDESVSVVGYTDGKYKATTGTIDSIQKSDKWFWIKVATPKESSGGPVLNSKGQVIGITVGYGDDSHNYAIPSNALKALLTRSIPMERLAAWQKRKNIRAEAQHSRGETKYFAKDYKNAIVEFDKAIEINPEHIRAYYKRGRTKYKLDDYKGAIDGYTHAIKLNPKHFRAYYNRGIAKYDINDYAGAIDDYTHAIKIDSDKAKTYSNRGGAKIKLGESKLNGGDAEKARNLYQEAIQDCTQTIKIEPGDYGAYKNRGIATAALGDIEFEIGNARKIKSLYQEGIIDYYKSIQLKISEAADAPTAHIEPYVGSTSTVHVAGWTGVSSGFFNGSGFFVDTDKIATNIHVVARPGPVFVKLKDKETIWEVVGVTSFDVENDLVVLKISGEGTPLPLGDSDAVQIGESIVAVGYPGGKYKVTKGKVHNIRNRDNWIRTTAKTSSGGSGGPLINSKGKVIGVNAQSGFYSLAIPSNVLKALLAQSELTESLVEWRKREFILAYADFVQGHIKLIKKDYEGAITDWNTAIQLNPKFALAYYKRGNVYESRKDYKAAIVNYDKAIELGLEDAFTYQNRGNVKRQLGKSKVNKGDVVEAQHLFQAAIDDFTHSIKFDYKHSYDYFCRGLTRTTLGKLKVDQGYVAEAQRLYQAAIEDYTQVIKLFPKNASAYNNRGFSKHTLAKSKEDQGNVTEAQQLYQEAINDYTKAIDITPNYVRAYKNRGIVKKALGQDEAAEKDFTKAKELESK